jgi:hypothetical protein
MTNKLLDSSSLPRPYFIVSFSSLLFGFLLIKAEAELCCRAPFMIILAFHDYL